MTMVAKGHANKAIATSLFISQATVKFHLSNIYRKLGVTNRTEPSRWAFLNGLLIQNGGTDSTLIR